MLENIEEEYSAFCKRLDSINQYINLLDSEKNFFKSSLVDEEIQEKDYIIKLIEDIKYNMNSQVIYNAIIISLYSCYENFIDNILIKYLETISNLGIKYEKLPKNILDNQIIQLGNYLSNTNRYKNYDLKYVDVINNLNNCLNGESEYKLNTRILITHSGNLGIDSLKTLFSQIGINNIFEKIKYDKFFEEYYMIENDVADIEELRRIFGSIEEKILFTILFDLVNRRNGIAHSWNEDDRLSIQTIQDKYIKFFSVFGKAIKDIIINEIYNILFDNNLLYEFSTIHQVINNKIVCLNNGNQKITKNDYIYAVSGDNKTKTIKIINIQINRNDVELVEEMNVDIGIEVDGYIKEGYKFYHYNNAL